MDRRPVENRLFPPQRAVFQKIYKVAALALQQAGNQARVNRWVSKQNAPGCGVVSLRSDSGNGEVGRAGLKTHRLL